MVHRISRQPVSISSSSCAPYVRKFTDSDRRENGAIHLTRDMRAAGAARTRAQFATLRALFEKDTPTAHLVPPMPAPTSAAGAQAAPPARRPRRQGARGRTSLLCRRKGCDEAAAPKVGGRELEEGDGDHDPDPGGEPGAEAAARRLRCVSASRSALDLDLTYTTKIIGTASAHRRRPQRRSRPARRRGRRRRAWRRPPASAPSSRSAARR